MVARTLAHQLMALLLGGVLNIFYSVSGVADKPTIYEDCVVCHGANAMGSQDTGAPRLAGQKETYLNDQLLNFVVGSRGLHESNDRARQMRDAVAHLSKDQMKELSRYLSGLSRTAMAMEVTNGDIEAGEAIYMGSCATCHGDRGRGTDSVMMPDLVILSDWYFKRQIEAYKTGERGGSEESTRAQYMAGMAHDLSSDEELSDLIIFLNSLRLGKPSTE